MDKISVAGSRYGVLPPSINVRLSLFLFLSRRYYVSVCFFSLSPFLSLHGKAEERREEMGNAAERHGQNAHSEHLEGVGGAGHPLFSGFNPVYAKARRMILLVILRNVDLISF